MHLAANVFDVWAFQRTGAGEPRFTSAAPPSYWLSVKAVYSGPRPQGPVIANVIPGV